MSSPIILCIVCLMVVIYLKIRSAERLPNGEQAIPPEQDMLWLSDPEIEELTEEEGSGLESGPIGHKPTFWMLL